MTFLIPDCEIKNVSLAEINFSNIDYKISRDYIDDKLIRSVKSNGILDPPVLFKENNSYIIIAGHNRLHVLRELEIHNTESSIIKRIEHEFFFQYAIRKNYRGEIGPIGKIRFVDLLKTRFQLDQKNNISVLKQLQIPAEIYYGREPWNEVAMLPGSLCTYIDSKDISFKNIKDILRLPEEAIHLLSDWVRDGMRVNIFRNIVDMLLDILKRDNSIKALKHIELKAISNRKRKEEFIFKELFNIRYPEYSEIRSKADLIIKQLDKSGLYVDFPEYYESDEIGMNLRINKREGTKSFRKKISEIDLNLIDDLLELL